MSTGKNHPLAAKSSVSFECPPIIERCLHEVYVNGRWMGVLVRHFVEKKWTKISIWDWYTGKEVFVSSSTISIFYVLNEDLAIPD